MATADEILAAAVEATADKMLDIDLDQRTITIPPSIKNLGVMSDDAVLWLHFRMPRMYGNIDLSLFKIRINYKNANGDPDAAPAKNVSIADDTITFSWEVERNATAYKGDVRFIVCLKNMGADETVSNEFNTTVATLPVLEGLETTEQVVQRNPDLVEAILSRLAALETKAAAKISSVILLASGWVGDSSPYSQVVDIDGVTARSRVDLNPSVEQLGIFYNKDLTFVAVNNAGVVTVYAIGDKPANDYIIQATITEVTAE